MDVTGRLDDGVLLERYRYPPGPAVTLPSHAHEEYQLNLSFGEPGGVHYRGAFHVVPAGQVSVVMPGETHTPRDPGARTNPSVHLTLYVRPDDHPHFRDAGIDDPDLARRFADLHRAQPTDLARDVGLVTFLADLGQRHGGVRTPPAPAAHRAVRTAREYLHANRTANVTLADLARETGLSRYHLTRVFTAGTGMPPHTYQLQLRVDLAKRLLLAGRTVTDAGHEAGFFDASHFTRHFKRHVGVPPGRYAADR
jgi:AraC-like DNA-binding protein